jgi:hypothetical protein
VHSDITHPLQRADHQPVPLTLDTPHRQVVDIDDPVRRQHVEFHQVDDARPTGQEGGPLTGQREGLGHGGRRREVEGVHHASPLA